MKEDQSISESVTKQSHDFFVLQEIGSLAAACLQQRVWVFRGSSESTAGALSSAFLGALNRHNSDVAQGVCNPHA